MVTGFELDNQLIQKELVRAIGLLAVQLKRFNENFERVNNIHPVDVEVKQ